MGIAVSNVLMPVIVKRWFPDRVGSMTGLYSMALALGTSAAAAITVPVTDALGGSWRSGLAVWAALAAAAVLPWIALVRHREAPSGNGTPPRAGGRHGTPTPGAQPVLRITRSRTAWALAVFFGLQATAAYITMGWMAQIFRDAGVSAGTAGLLLAVTMVMGVPLAFVIPRLATRLPRQGPIVIALGLCGLAGYAGLYLAPWRRLGLGRAARHRQLLLPARPDDGRDAGQDRCGRGPAVGVRAEHRVSDLDPGAAPGRRALPEQRRLGLPIALMVT